MLNTNKFQRWWMNSWVHRWRIRTVVPQFLRACPEPFRGEVLEIGSGGGWTSRQILETFPQVELTATDIDPRAGELFERLREKYGRRLKVKQANVLKLPFDRDSFDIIIAINVLPFLQSYGVRKALHELLRVTRPGGLIGLSDHVTMPVPRRFSRPMIEELLRGEACDIVYGRGQSRYDLWVKKKYPIEENGL